MYLLVAHSSFVKFISLKPTPITPANLRTIGPILDTGSGIILKKEEVYGTVISNTHMHTMADPQPKTIDFWNKTVILVALTYLRKHHESLDKYRIISEYDSAIVV